MTIDALVGPVLISVVFGLVVAGVQLLIEGSSNPFPVRQWLGQAWRLACLCYIILYGVIKV